MIPFGIGPALGCLLLAALSAAVLLVPSGLLGQGGGGALPHLAAAGFAVAAILDQSR